jgi:hypothetical protein
LLALLDKSHVVFCRGDVSGTKITGDGELLPVFAVMLASSFIARLLLLSAQAKER